LIEKKSTPETIVPGTDLFHAASPAKDIFINAKKNTGFIIYYCPQGNNKVRFS